MRPVPSTGRRAAAALAAFIVAVTATRGAAPAPPLVERSTVELVLIEAYVTDPGGRAIAGLGPDDFVLKIDGLVRPIASFDERASGLAAATGEPGSRGGARAGPLPRRIVFFFDDGTSSPQGLTLARDAAQRFLADGLLSTDQIALARHRERLEMVVDFTTDRQLLRRALQAERDDKARVSLFWAESRERTNRLFQAWRSASSGARGGSASPGQVAFLVRGIAEEEIRQMRGSVTALETLVDSLSGWPGSKAIVYFGDGLPEFPGQEHAHLALARLGLPPSALSKEIIEAYRWHGLTHEIYALVRAASGAGVTLHTIQTAGLTAGSAGEVASAARRSNALEAVSLNTGGVHSSSNDVRRALAEADAASRAYYVIGYAPEGPPDGAQHTVHLRVKRSGARVRFRRGFTRFPPEEIRRRTLQAAHLVPGMYRDLDLELAAVPGPSRSGTRLLDLVLHVPPGRVVALPGPDRYRIALEVGIVATGEAGVESLRVARQALVLVEPDVARQDLAFDIVLRARLPSSMQTITAVLRDQATGAVGAERIVIPSESGAAGAQGLALYSLDEKSVWIELRDGAREGGGDAYNVGPALKTRFAPGESIACAFRTEGLGLSPDRPLMIRVRTADRVIRELEVPPGAFAAETLKVPIGGGMAAAGAYVLLLQQDETEGRSRVLGSVEFTVHAPAAPSDPGA